MVSTRGVSKLKFFDGERVLCYEPDPTKAKVLYDSKVLEVVTNKDSRGRKAIEYLIHFQGWNSSWDRCVSEDFVLKDTPENRQLQRDLAEKAQLQLGAYLYRRERKKRKERKLSDRLGPSSEDGSSGSPAPMDTDDAQTTGATSSSDTDSDTGEEDAVQLELTPYLRSALENDGYLINGRGKLVRLPAEPHVVAILEKYWKHYACRELSKITDKPNTRNRQSTGNNASAKVKPEHVHRNLNTCKELVDGLRVYFDFTLSDLLLYSRERDQVIMAQATVLSCLSVLKMENVEEDGVKCETEDVEYSHLPSLDAGLDNGRRWLRSHRGSGSDAELNGQAELVSPRPARSSLDSCGKLTMNWQLLPEHVYNQDPPPPCLIYGAVHLARLLVKLPDLLYATNMPEDKFKLLLGHLDLFVEFLSDHKEWFGDKHYVESHHLH